MDKLVVTLKVKHLLTETFQYLNQYKKIKYRCNEHYENFFKLCIEYRERKEEMIDSKFLQFLINDIISTGEYTLEGIAYYLRVSFDDIIDIYSGINKFPSYQIVFQLIDLHRTVKPNEYQADKMDEDLKNDNEK